MTRPAWADLGEVEFLDWLIENLDAIGDEHWRTETVRRTDAETGAVTNCVMGHVFDLGGGDDLADFGDGFKPRSGGSTLWDVFESCVATTYRIYPVNDGENPDYPQATPRERCVAYIRAVRDCTELSTTDSMEAESRCYDGRYATRAAAEAALFDEVRTRRAARTTEGASA